MYRIINSLVTAEFNKDIGAVEVNFNGHGNSSLYHHTMDIAMNIAVMYDTNCWLFTKDFFHDIDVDNFLFFIRKWSKRCSELFEPHSEHRQCKVALLTTADSYEHLSEQHGWLEGTHTKLQYLDLRIFLCRDEANAYLASKVGEKNSERISNLFTEDTL